MILKAIFITFTLFIFTGCASNRVQNKDIIPNVKPTECGEVENNMRNILVDTKNAKIAQ